MPAIVLRLNDVLVSDAQRIAAAEYLHATLARAHDPELDAQIMAIEDYAARQDAIRALGARIMRERTTER